MVKAAVAYADTADHWRSYEDRCITSPDSSITGLRAFVRYHKDARQDFMIAGRMRSLTHKQVAMHGLIARMASSEGRVTVRAMAKEANVAPSTLTRFMDKLQLWGEYAIDITRGRLGGVKIRRRWVGDGLARYAARAWERVCKAANRARINVAFFIPGTRSDPVSSSTPMDATFTGGESVEQLGVRVRLGEITIEEAQAAARGDRERPPTDAEQEWERAQEWAARCVDEIRELNRIQAGFGFYRGEGR